LENGRAKITLKSAFDVDDVCVAFIVLTLQRLPTHQSRDEFILHHTHHPLITIGFNSLSDDTEKSESNRCHGDAKYFVFKMNNVSSSSGDIRLIATEQQMTDFELLFVG
jgi:hypothetical protein